MNKKGSKTVPIEGLTDKRNITLTFSVTLSGIFLPMQIIYSGKTKASQPRNFVFPNGFCVTQNEKHWSNEEETLKLIKEIINPYVVRTRKALNLPCIWDVFKGQMTDRVQNRLKSLSIELVPVPANMTHFFQPLDLTVNREFNKKGIYFILLGPSVIQKGLNEGKALEDIQVDVRLTVIKPLHAQWLVNCYNFFSTEEGRQITLKGWKKAGILGLFDGILLYSST